VHCPPPGGVSADGGREIPGGGAPKGWALSAVDVVFVGADWKSARFKRYPQSQANKSLLGSETTPCPLIVNARRSPLKAAERYGLLVGLRALGFK
jgi:hypothetical protein